jgi:dihydroorotate dehydrogenase (fumarate)
MIDLTTTYLGLELKNPIVCSSSPLGERIATLVHMERAGAAAVVLPSLFEEQIEIESLDLAHFLDRGSESYAEALSYFPDMIDYNQGADGYLDHLRRAKAVLTIPVIASLNGVSRGGWVRYARMIADAGADALELNLYHLATDPEVNSAAVEDQYVALVRDIKAEIGIPLAVKLSPFITAPVALGRRLAAAGAGALVLFNRFYQPDFDLDELTVKPILHLSSPQELLLRLHWTALLYGRVQSDLAVTGGVHTAHDVIKVMMAGAKVAMMTSALLKHGIDHVQMVREQLLHWLSEHGYRSVRQMLGSMSFRAVDDPAAYSRGNYMKVLRSYAVKGHGMGAR